MIRLNVFNRLVKPFMLVVGLEVQTQASISDEIGYHSVKIVGLIAYLNVLMAKRPATTSVVELTVTIAIYVDVTDFVLSDQLLKRSS